MFFSQQRIATGEGASVPHLHALCEHAGAALPDEETLGRRGLHSSMSVSTRERDPSLHVFYDGVLCHTAEHLRSSKQLVKGLLNFVFGQLFFKKKITYGIYNNRINKYEFTFMNPMPNDVTQMRN